jgi:DoxX
MIDLYKRVTASVGWPLYAIPLRLIVGFGFMEHGYAKLARGTESFAAILHALGTPAPALFAWITIVVELFGGLGGPARSADPAGERPDGGGAGRGGLHRTPPQRVQFDQAAVRGCGGRAFRAAGLRDGPALFSGSCGAGARRTGALGSG